MELLKGKAEFSQHRNDMYWSCCIMDDNYKFYHIEWWGYDDHYWWTNVSEGESIKEVDGKKFKLDYKTLEVTEVIGGDENG